MTPPVELRLRFDGTTPGLADHCLSIGAFKKALPLLLASVQKTVDVVAGVPEADAERRKTPGLGKQFDLQITRLDDGSLTLVMSLVLAATVAQPAELRDGGHTAIASRAAQQFLGDVKKEWNTGGGRRESVRRYLEALPEGVTTQDYEAVIEGRVVEKVVLGSREATADEQQMVPRTREVHGTISAVTFGAAGRVRIRDNSGKVHVCSASADVVDLAVELHRVSVSGTVLISDDMTRLIAIREQGQPRSSFSAGERLAYLCDHWGEALRRLAE
jgi:hypothetical protein